MDWFQCLTYFINVAMQLLFYGTIKNQNRRYRTFSRQVADLHLRCPIIKLIRKIVERGIKIARFS